MFGEWKAKRSPVLNGAPQSRDHCTEASADHSVKPLVWSGTKEGRPDFWAWLIPVLEPGESRAFHPCWSGVPMQF